MTDTWKTDYSGDLEVTTFLQGINDGMDALDTKFSGDEAPESTAPNRDWADTTNNLLKRRNNDNDTWLVDGKLDEGMLYNDNILINGEFNVWQRNDAFTILNSSAGYFSDMWVLGNNSGSSVVVNEESFTPGQTDVPNNPSKFARISKSGGSGNVSIFNIVPNVSVYSGKTITISIYLKCDSSITNAIKIFSYQLFGSGGSDSVYKESSSMNVTTEWVRYSATIDLDSVSGKTIGGLNNIRFGIVISSGATGTFDIACAKAEEGNVSTKFIPETFEKTLDKCLPFYQKSYAYGNPPGYSTSDGMMWGLAAPSGTLIGLNVLFEKSMYADPAVVVFTPSGTPNKVLINNGSESSISLTPKCHKGFRVFAGGSSLSEIAFHYTAIVSFID